MLRYQKKGKQSPTRFDQICGAGVLKWDDGAANVGRTEFTFVVYTYFGGRGHQTEEGP